MINIDSCNKNPWLEPDTVKIWLKTEQHIQLDAFHLTGNKLLILGSDFSVSATFNPLEIDI